MSVSVTCLGNPAGATRPNFVLLTRSTCVCAYSVGDNDPPGVFHDGRCPDGLHAIKVCAMQVIKYAKASGGRWCVWRLAGVQS